MITVDIDCTDLRTTTSSEGESCTNSSSVNGSIFIRLHYNGVRLPVFISVSEDHGDTLANINLRVIEKLESLLTVLDHPQAILYIGEERCLFDELFNRLEHLIIAGESHSLTSTIGG